MSEAVPDFGRRLPWWLARPAEGPAPSAGGLFDVYARAYAAATLLRLTLPDAMQWSWLPATLVQGTGAILIAVNGCLAGWLLCGLGALGSILWLQDQLTQSGYLLACALAVIAHFAGSRAGRPERLRRGLPQTVRVLTLLIYLLAGFHKLNADFFDPAVSCANGGLRALATHGQASPLVPATLLDASLWAPLFLALELGLPLLALWRPGIAVVAMAAFHLPLTIIFAPGFAFTMMSGWVCLLGEPRLRALAETLRRRWLPITLAALAPGAASALWLFPARWRTDPDWRIKELVLWWVLSALLVAATSHRQTFGGRAPWGSTRRSPRTLAFAVLFALHGLTPYLGLGFHRTGAMLSNLRIDDGCANHLLMPAALRIFDPYVRVEDIAFAPGRAAPGFEEQVEARLWSLTALWRARAHWCDKHDEPLPLTAHHAGRKERIADFCAADGWPWPRPWLPGMRRFQVNLLARCPQACLH